MKNKITEYRTMQGLTIKALAEYLKISSQSLLNIEGCKQLPSVKTALKLARLFKLPVDQLFIL